MNFFEKFPEFEEQGKTGVLGKRLEYRYSAIIENQKKFFKNSKVLDLASHDGRWSLAALEAGAVHVTGIEGRKHLAEKSKTILKKYGYNSNQFEIFVDDLNNKICEFKEGAFDIILCLGFFYHTMHHFKLLSEFRRLKARLIIIDGLLYTNMAPGIVLGLEDSNRDGSSLQTTKELSKALIGIPTVKGLEMMLEHLGYQSVFLDWAKFGQSDWKGIDDYRKNLRFTVIVKPKSD